jgi:D-alanyl-lipoteichoic acid acyltransferase DltB (MBOAT superfamily)
MLFNSYVFIFEFLPVTLIGYFLIGKRRHHSIAIGWLVGASLFYYGWWNPAYLGLILGSILINYAIGVILGRNKERNAIAPLVFGIIINLAFLGYFKYTNFFIDNFNSVFSSNIYISQITLPLAISFFTFQQLAYLVDTYKGDTKESNFLHYCLFVTFFPQ